MMIVLHEIEEIKIGDLTPFDKITKEEKRELGKQAVEEVLNTLNKKVQYIELIEEFESMKTKESIFAKMCDKLEADIQCKLYCEADLFIENDRPRYTEKVFENIADYIKQNNLLK